MEIDLRLKEYREEAGNTQRELARLSGVSQGYISDLEAGKKDPRLTQAAKLARALGVLVDDLLESDEIGNEN